MHSCKAFLPHSGQEPWGCLNASNTPECVAPVRTRTSSMPSWKNLIECLVTLPCALSHTTFISKVFNNLEIPLRVFELFWCALLTASFMNQMSSYMHSLHRLVEFQLSVAHSLHLA
jgi:hypothetical protein